MNYNLKWILLIIVSVISIGLFHPTPAFAATCTASVSGNWNVAATWGGTCNSNSFPIAGDTVNINSGITVNVTANAAAASVTFPTSTANTVVSINSGVTLAVSGAVTIPKAGGGGNIKNTLSVGSGTLTAGSVAFTNINNNQQKSFMTISTGTATVSGNITNDGANNKIGGAVVFTGAGTLNVGGTFFTAVATQGTITTVAGSTINYNASGAQTVRAITYSGNLVLSGSGAKTMASGTSVTGNVNIVSSATATPTATITVGTLKLNGAGQTNGTWGKSGSGATHTNDTYFTGTSGVFSVTTSSVDTTAPTISSVTSNVANGTYKVGQVIDIQVTFSEAVTSTGSVTVNLNTSRSCTFTVSSSATGSCTYTVQSGDTTSGLNVSSISGTIADTSSNPMTNFTPATNLSSNKTIVIDTTAPTVTNVTSSTTNGSYAVGATISIQVTFSEAVTVGGVPQLTLETGATDRVLNYVSGSGGTTLTFNYIVQATDASSDLNYKATDSLALNGGTITDAATNTATLTLPSLLGAGSLATNKAIVIDTTAPYVVNVTSSNSNGNYKAGDTIAIQVVFSEAVTVSNTPHITLLTGSPVSKTVNYSSGSGTNTLEFDYLVGNNNFTADLEYTSAGALSTSSSGSASTIQDAAGNAASTTLPTPGAGTIGAGSLGVNKDIVIDSVAPTVAITSTSPSLTNVAIPVTAKFSETVTGFVVGDISVTNGTAGSFSGSGSTYTFVITPTSQGSVSFYIPAATSVDVGGNANTVSNTISRTYDSIHPSVSLSTATTSPTLTTPITYTATFSEAVTGFTISDVTVTNATVGNFRTISSTVYRFDVSPIGSPDPLINVDVYTSIDVDKAFDTAGNGNTASNSGVPQYIRFDNHSPTVGLTSSVSDFISDPSFNVTATFSESVTGFDASDISVTNGTAGTVSGSGTTYTFSVTASGQGAVSVSVSASSAEDTAHNQNLASNVLSTTYDTGAPTVVLTTDEADPTNADSFSVTATFSEAVSGFDESDIQVTNGTASNFLRTDYTYTIYTFDITPTGQGEVDISIPQGGSVDAASNENEVSNTLSLTYDSVAPILAETGAVSTLTADATPDYTFTTTENGSIIYGGSCSSVTTSASSSGPNIITFNTLANGTYNDCSIIVTDAAGNGSTPLLISPFTVSNSNPVITSLSPLNLATGVSATANLVLTFDKAVTVGTGNITIKTGATTVETIDVTGPKVTGSGTAIITVDPSSTLSSQTSYYVQIDSTAFHDSTSNYYAGISDSTTWTFTTADTVAPTATLSPLTNSVGVSTQPVFVMTFSENVVVQSGGFITLRKADNSVVEDISVTSGKVTGSGTSILRITPSTVLDGSTNYHITITAGAITDSSGNPYAAISDSTTWTFQTVDTSTPFVVSFSPGNLSTGVGSTSNLIMNFDRAMFVQTGGTITITGGVSPEVITLPDARVTGSGATAITINPTTNFLSQTVYNVQVSALAFNDVSGGTGNYYDGISDSTTWTFTTADTTAPTLSGVSLSSNNSLSSSQAKVGNTVSLLFTSSETITTPTVTFRSGGALVTNTVSVVNTSSNNWAATYITHSSDTDGSVTYNISYQDTAGNSGTAVTSGTGSVTFDKTAPTFSSVGLVSNNTTNTQAKSGDTITLSFVSVETISAPSVTFTSGSAPVTGTVTVTPSGNNWTATYTTSSSDTAGSIAYNIFNFHDAAGNDGSSVTSGTGSVTFDKTAPVFSSVTPTSSSFITNVTSSSTIAFTSSETLTSGSITITRTSGTADGTVHTCTLKGDALASGSHTIDLSDTTNNCTSNVSSLVSGAVYTFVFVGSDAAGNAATTVTRTSVTFDNTAPTLSSVSLSSNNSTTTLAKVGNTVTLSFTSSETISTPVVTFSSGSVSVANTVLIDHTGNDWTASYVTSSFDTTGAVTYSISSYNDNAGNSGSTVTTGAGSVTLDKTAPTITNITSNKANGSYTTGESIDIRVTFSETVTSTGDVTVTLDAGGTCVFTVTASSTGSCNYSVQNGDASSDLTVTSISGTVTDPAGNAITDFAPATNLAANKDIVIDTNIADTSAPTISDVTSSKTNGAYKAGEIINISVTFSETVTSTGDVTVTLDTGGACAFTVTSSSSGNCDYTVQAGENSSDLTVTSISGTIADLSDNPMTDFAPAVNLATNKNIVIDTTSPEINDATPTFLSTLTNVTSSSGVSFTASETLASGSITITRTGGTADGTVHTCTLKGDALSSGSHTIDLSDTTNSCTSNVSGLVSGAVYTFVFAGSDAAENAASTIYRLEVLFDSTVTVTSITVSGTGDATTISTDGGTLQMLADVLPVDATDSSVTWSVTPGTGSANISGSGLLTATGNGTVTVTATANDGSEIFGELEIAISGQVLPPTPVTDIAVSGTDDITAISVDGGTLQMLADVLPLDATDPSVTWSVIPGTGYATIDGDGLLTASTDGDVTVTATANDGSGIFGEIVITISGQTVPPTSVTDITVTGTDDATTISADGGTLQMLADVLPVDATDSSITWSVAPGSGSANISGSGLLTALSNGTVTVTATANDGSEVFGDIVITISGQTISTTSVTSITVSGTGDATTISTDGGTLQMLADVLPVDATDSSVTWSVTPGTGSANISGSGLLTATGNGTVTVTATANDGSEIFGELEIAISGQVLPPTPVTDIAVSGTDDITAISVDGGTLQMLADVLPLDATDPSVTWSVIPGTGYATIDGDGLLTASTDGDVTVTATANDGSGIFGEIVITISGQTVPPTPIASPVSGTYTGTQSVTLSASGSNSIRYSFSGIPADCSSGTSYTGPISVSTTKTIYVRACDSSGDSSTSSFAYIIHSASTGGGGGGGGSSGGGSIIPPEIITPPVNPSSGLGCQPGYKYSPVTGALCPGGTQSSLPGTENTIPTLGLPGECMPEQILTQNLHAPARDNQYDSYTRGIVKEVKILQAHMNRLGFRSGKEDGILGPITDGAIRRMQTFLGTKPDGYVGPITRGLINNSCGIKL